MGIKNSEFVTKALFLYPVVLEMLLKRGIVAKKDLNFACIYFSLKWLCCVNHCDFMVSSLNC